MTPLELKELKKENNRIRNKIRYHNDDVYNKNQKIKSIQKYWNEKQHREIMKEYERLISENGDFSTDMSVYGYYGI